MRIDDGYRVFEYGLLLAANEVEEGGLCWVAWTTSRKALCRCLPRASQAYRSAGGLAYGRQARRDRPARALPDDRRYQRPAGRADRVRGRQRHARRPFGARMGRRPRAGAGRGQEQGRQGDAVQLRAAASQPGPAARCAATSNAASARRPPWAGDCARRTTSPSST